jgi:hypothetical protein
VVFVLSTAVGAIGIPVNFGEDVTKAVVASCLVFVPCAAVGAAGIPVKFGDSIGATPLQLIPSVVMFKKY